MLSPARFMNGTLVLYLARMRATQFRQATLKWLLHMRVLRVF